MVSVIKNFITQHVVIRLVEEQREHLDENFIEDVPLTDLSNAFDCIKHDPLIAKLTAFGFSDSALYFIHSY